VRQIARGSDDEKSVAPGVNALWRWLATVTTALALFLLILRPPGMPNAMLDEAVSSHVRSLMADHLTDVASTDQHTVKPWFTGKIDFAPSVTDFADQGFPLVGGRLDYLADHPVAALVYHHAKHVINVFVWPDTAVMTSKAENLRGYNVINCSTNGLHYCLVSDLNAKELGDLAGLLAKQ
jgi:anti-sigma factor RsiW